MTIEPAPDDELALVLRDEGLAGDGSFRMVSLFAIDRGVWVRLLTVPVPRHWQLSPGGYPADATGMS